MYVLREGLRGSKTRSNYVRSTELRKRPVYLRYEVLLHEQNYYSLTCIDLWHRGSDLAWLRNEVTPLHGDLNPLELFLYKVKSSENQVLQEYHERSRRRWGWATEVQKSAIPFKIQTQAFTPPPGREWLHPVTRSRKGYR